VIANGSTNSSICQLSPVISRLRYGHLHGPGHTSTNLRSNSSTLLFSSSNSVIFPPNTYHPSHKYRDPSSTISSTISSLLPNPSPHNTSTPAQSPSFHHKSNRLFQPATFYTYTFHQLLPHTTPHNKYLTANHNP